MPALNPETVARVCTELFGQRPASVAGLSGQGTFHAIYRISFAQEDTCILRANVLPHLGHAYEFLIDSWIMDLLQSHGLPSVAVRHVDLSREVFPFDYEILDEAQGEPLNRDEITIRGLVHELGRTMARVHGIETDGFGLLDVRSVVMHPGTPGKGLQRNWQEYIMLNLEDHLRICCGIGVIDAEESLKISK
jgi:hypothetical protein